MYLNLEFELALGDIQKVSYTTQEVFSPKYQETMANQTK